MYIHCNRCLLHQKEATNQSIDLFVYGCGHIFCRQCLNSGTGKQCYVCKAPNPTSTPINSNLSEDMKCIMSSPASLLKAIEQNLGFQKMQGKIFAELSEKRITEMEQELKNVKSR